MYKLHDYGEHDGKDRFYLYENEKGKQVKYFSHDCLCYSDYGGAYDIGKANCRTLKKDFPEYHTGFSNEYEDYEDMPKCVIKQTAYGELGFMQESEEWEEIKEALENYPLLVDEEHNTLQYEEEQEAAEFWIKHDFKTNNEDFEDIWDMLTIEKQLEYFFDTVSDLEIYSEWEGTSVYFPGVDEEDFTLAIENKVLFEHNPLTFEGSTKYREYLELHGQGVLFSKMNEDGSKKYSQNV
jgi:hypothetical protein